MTTVMFLGGPKDGEFETMPGLPTLVLEVAVIDSEAPTYADFDIENPAASMPTIRRERYRLIRRSDGTYVYVHEDGAYRRQASNHRSPVAIDVNLPAWQRELLRELFLSESVRHDAPLFTRAMICPQDEYLSPDAHSMSFADMTEEAEAELAAWRGILHPE